MYKKNTTFNSRTEQRKYIGGFHNAIRPALIFAQPLGLMPVYGLTNKSPQKLYFKMCSKRVAYTIFTWTLFIGQAILTSIWIFEKKLEFGKVGMFKKILNKKKVLLIKTFHLPQLHYFLL